MGKYAEYADVKLKALEETISTLFRETGAESGLAGGCC